MTICQERRVYDVLMHINEGLIHILMVSGQEGKKQWGTSCILESTEKII